MTRTRGAGRWHWSIAVLTVLSVSGQCSVCGARFEGWDGGVCGACQATGR